MRTHALVVAVVVLVSGGARAMAAEVCGDGLDNDSDGMADDGCWPAAVTGVCESPLACAVTGAIAPKLGSVVYELEPDVQAHVPYGPTLSLRRTYMSAYQPSAGTAAYRRALGSGWQHNWMSWLDKDTAPNPDQVIVHLPTGREVLFRYASTTGGYDYYTPQVGAHCDYLRQSTSAPNKWQLRMLTGEVYVYSTSGSVGKLTEVWDTLSTPNILTITYDANGQVQYVTDAIGARRLSLVYDTSARLSRVDYQTITSGVPTMQAYVVYTYNTSGLLAKVQPNGSLAQQYTYSANELSLFEDGAGNDRIAYVYTTAGPRQVARLKSGQGELGFEYASARTACTGGTVVFFNRQGATACASDGDCGAGLLCGGQTDSSLPNTGVCYRAARCMQVSSPSDDLVTTVTPIGPPSQTCEGACTDRSEYIWNTSSTLDLKAAKDPLGNHMSYSYNASGLPTRVEYGDNDDDAANGGGVRTLYLFYGNASFPGRVTEVRRQSDLNSGACDATTSGGCQRTLYTYSTDGLVSSRQELGFTVNSTGAYIPYSYTTTYSYDGKGRRTLVDGPLAGSDDVTAYTYWASTDVNKNGQLKEIKQKKDSANYVITLLDDYDYWGNARSIKDPDATFTCLKFDPAQNFVSEVREAMNGQTSCATVNAADLVTAYTRDKALRLTKVQYADGGCAMLEYDTNGRPLRQKTRDNCNAASSGETLEYTYDDDGLRVKVEVKDAAGTVVRRQQATYYDSRRLATLVNPVVPTAQAVISYDDRGLVDSVEGESNSSKVAYGYDAAGRLVQVDRYRSPSAFDSWVLVEDWLGTTMSVTDDDSKVIGDKHDDLGRKVETSTADGGTDLRVYNADGSLATLIEASGSTGALAHSYTFDNLRRQLTIDYAGSCGAGAPVETSFVYDAPPVACPSGVGCARTAGKLAYVRTTLLCGSTYADNALDQETFYSYDDGGRMIREYIRDDSGRVASHAYTWTRRGALSQVTTPSGAIMGWTFGSAADNSDQSKISAAWRTSAATPIVDNIAWMPFGPVKSYRHQNSIGGTLLQSVFSYNLAYRMTNTRVEKTTGALVFQAAMIEDNKGRVTGRDFSGGVAGLQDSYYLYDGDDRIVCETPTSVTSCPSTGMKMSHDSTPPFTASNDWKRFQRPIPGKADTEHVVTLVAGTDQIASVAEPITSYGVTNYSFDARGNRVSDDNVSSLSHDARTYTYDGARRLRTVNGEYFFHSGWHAYTLTNAYDGRGRRVFKSFLDLATMVEQQTFFYYDPYDRLVEVRHTYDVNSPVSIKVHQVGWLGQRAVGVWSTDLVTSTTTRRYLHTDDSTRPIETYSWPASGDAVRAWAVNPDAWGADTLLAGATEYQPFLFTGQYRDDETAALTDDGVTPHRSAIVLNGFRSYDPYVGSYLQVDPEVPSTWDSYVYVGNNPVGNTDPDGRMMYVGGVENCGPACEYVPQSSDCWQACQQAWGCELHGCSGLGGGAGSGLGEWEGTWGGYGWDETRDDQWDDRTDPDDLNGDGISNNDCGATGVIANCQGPTPEDPCVRLHDRSEALHCHPTIDCAPADFPGADPNCEVCNFIIATQHALGCVPSSNVAPPLIPDRDAESFPREMFR